MIRTIIRIDEDKCDGCGLCVRACHEGALGLVDGKAKLLRDDYCDGMGDCLPACPAGAIAFIEREAAAYDEAAVAANMAARKSAKTSPALSPAGESKPAAPAESALCNWPVQIKLAPPAAPYFAGVDLLIAADCTAFAYAGFHADFMAGRVTLVGCPKLDAIDYADKLALILLNNDIRSVLVARMQVPCCGGIEYATRRAIEASGKDLPLEVVTISTSGSLVGV